MPTCAPVAPASYEALGEPCLLAHQLLKRDPKHPSLHFKPVGRYWSVRVGAHYRALGVAAEGGVLWFWIGSHSDYDRMIG